MERVNRRQFLQNSLALASVGLLSGCGLALPTDRGAAVRRIGVLVAGSAPDLAPLLAAFRQGLRELGYMEGRNVAICSC